MWTNNVRVEKFSAYVDGYFKVDLPVPPDEFYVSLEQTRIGIIRGEIRLEWKRGNAIFHGCACRFSISK